MTDNAKTVTAVFVTACLCVLSAIACSHYTDLYREVLALRGARSNYWKPTSVHSETWKYDGHPRIVVRWLVTDRPLKDGLWASAKMGRRMPGWSIWKIDLIDGEKAITDSLYNYEGEDDERTSADCTFNDLPRDSNMWIQVLLHSNDKDPLITTSKAMSLIRDGEGIGLFISWLRHLPETTSH